MKFLLLLGVTLAVCSLGFAEEFTGLYEDPAHPGKCVYKGLILSPGEQGRLPDNCGRLLCGVGSSAKIQTCAVYGLDEGCRFTDYIDEDGPYPECCERKIECP